ncbi:hypothetical protein FHR84_002006 [Actinopolyspora biskrensis]|uniref:DUF3558 domain-containing protein n=1 Tax=Actinopolyspora biskrensis TaxID=1470178 RepID=A0A852YVM4_9ACTN|nr:DUF3558 family protein [Actinopolyspora biskrensis]NYH78681.1 hypothetical protein [Actinopolyspora biskrensis]
MSRESGAGFRRGSADPKRVSLCAGVLLVTLAGCSGGGSPADGAGSSSEASPSSSGVSTTREVPEKERERLGELSAERLCELVGPAELGRFAFPVESGSSEEVSFDPPVRGCRFPGREGERSVLVAAQPDGYHEIGSEEVTSLPVTASRTSHANDCTVYSDVAGTTLQVTVAVPEAGPEQCDTAAEVSRRVLRPLVY